MKDKRKNTPGDWKEPRALLVDDSRIHLLILSEMLRRKYVRTKLCRNGREALSLMCQEKYDLIFLDDRMPGMSGVETLRLASTMKGNRNLHTPVIAATGQEEARERYLNLGFSDYLPKPIHRDALAGLLARFMPGEEALPASEKQAQAGREGQMEPEEKLVDVQAGIAICDGEADLYYVIASMFAGEYKEKSEQIQAYYDAGDWRGYRVYVHALGSTALQAGCLGLSERAKQMEALVGTLQKTPAEAGEILPRIREAHSPLMALYARAAKAAENLQRQ